MERVVGVDYIERPFGTPDAHALSLGPPDIAPNLRWVKPLIHRAGVGFQRELVHHAGDVLCSRGARDTCSQFERLDAGVTAGPVECRRENTRVV